MLIFRREGKKRMGRRERDGDRMRQNAGWPALRRPGEEGGGFDGGGFARPIANPSILYPLSMIYDATAPSIPFPSIVTVIDERVLRCFRWNANHSLEWCSYVSGNPRQSQRD